MADTDRLHSPRIGALDKQRSFPPGVRTLDTKCYVFGLRITEQRRDRGDIGRGFRRKRLARRKVLFIPCWTRVIGRDEARRSEASCMSFTYAVPANMLSRGSNGSSPSP